MGDVQILKYLTFTKAPQPEDGKTSIWIVSNTSNGIELGRVSWLSIWRKYCFFPKPNTAFDTVCMETIITFVKNLMELRRHKRVKEKL